jgi:hypothetical protein
MYYKFTYLFLLSVAFSFLFVACAEKEKPGIRLAKQWCDCNKPIVPLQYNLQQATTSGQRQSILDSMRLLTAKVMQCMGGESEIVKLDQEMTDSEKDEFNKTFRRVREETCPEVFQAISNMENALIIVD